MKTPAQRLQSLLSLHKGRCAIRECTDLAIAAYDLERRGRVKVEPQHSTALSGYKMLVVTRL